MQAELRVQVEEEGMPRKKYELMASKSDPNIRFADKDVNGGNVNKVKDERHLEKVVEINLLEFRCRYLQEHHSMMQDWEQRDKVSIEYCPTDKMIADCKSRLLQRAKFSEFRKVMLGK